MVDNKGHKRIKFTLHIRVKRGTEPSQRKGGGRKKTKDPLPSFVERGGIARSEREEGVLTRDSQRKIRTRGVKGKETSKKEVGGVSRNALSLTRKRGRVEILAKVAWEKKCVA